MMIQDNVYQTECKRCGKCCVAGGPVLHKSDRDLVVSGKLLPKDLILFRKYEIAYDPVKNNLMTLDIELIKIRGKNLIDECKYFDRKDSSCSIYDIRPIECRLLKCWDTNELEKILMKELLSRADLIPKHSVLWEIIQEHERLFNLHLINGTLLTIKKDTEKQTFLKDLFKKECEFRDAIIKQFDISEEDLLFFLGRPLWIIFDEK